MMPFKYLPLVDIRRDWSSDKTFVNAPVDEASTVQSTPPPLHEQEFDEAKQDHDLVGAVHDHGTSSALPVLGDIEPSVQRDSLLSSHQDSPYEERAGKIIFARDPGPVDSVNYWDAIRLLTLAPGRFNDDIKCELSHVYLRHTASGQIVLDQNPLGRDPVYESLSYTWGDQSRKREIWLNSEKFSVTANLECALRYLRKTTEPRTLWVDAICINQDDVEEKNVQVLRMGQVYRQASSTIIWLGEESEHSNRALHLLEHLGGFEEKMKSVNRHENFSAFDLRDLMPEDSSELMSFEQLDEHDWTALYDLFERPWWKRVWVIQEVTYSRDARLICGAKSIPWDTLHNIVTVNKSIFELHLVERIRPIVTCILDLDSQRRTSILLLLDFGFRNTETSLSSLLSPFSGQNGFRSSDPRDQIHGLLGLASCPEAFPVDYSKSVREVYTEATKMVIQELNVKGKISHPGLNVICAGYSPTKGDYDLPSWVPDWSNQQSLFPVDFSGRVDQLYDATRGAKYIDSVVMDDNVLLSYGIIWDEIGFVGVICWSDIWNEEPRKHIEYKEVYACKLQWKDQALGSKTYPGGDDPVDAFWRTLLFDTGVRDRFTAKDLPRIRKAFQQWSSTSVDNTSEGYQSEDERMFDRMSTLWRFSITKKGYFGMVPVHSQVGDRVCVMFGVAVPLIIRQVGSPDSSERRHVLVGPAYVHGIMDGEIMDRLAEREVVEEVISLV